MNDAVSATTASALERSSPELQGIPRSAVANLLDEADRKQLELHSLMILRHGKVVAEGWWAPYQPQTPHLLYSLSKSFTSTAIGLAVEEGLLSLDDQVISFFPDALPDSVSENLRALKIRHLLTMSTGQPEADRPPLDWEPGSAWVKQILAYPITVPPGSQFAYSNPATYLCSAILNRVAKQDLLEYLTPRLFEPLGIEKPHWQKSPEGISFGASGLYLATESIAKFGQLYLQKGVWNAVRILPEHWVELATSKQVSNDTGGDPDWSLGYGFQFWRAQHDSYRGDGAFGQFCLVIPHSQVVVAITSSVARMQDVLDLVWNSILPELAEDPLPESADFLSSRLSHLRLAGPRNLATPASGQMGARFVSNGASWEVNESAEGVELRFTSDTASYAYRAGYEDWVLTETSEHRQGLGPAAAKAGWQTPTKLIVEIHELASPLKLDIDFDFGDDALEVKTRFTAWFGPAEDPVFLGRRA